MKHLKSNYASNPQGIGPLFDSVKPKTLSRMEVNNLNDPLTRPARVSQRPAHSFDGVTYEPKFDATRLRGEMSRVYKIMCAQRDVIGMKRWLTLREISELIGDPEASISARLRDLRKAKFGSHTVERRRRGDPRKGLYEYRLLGMSE